MSLIACKDCKQKFSSDSKRCPHCGAKAPDSILKIAAAIFSITMVFVVMARQSPVLLETQIVPKGPVSVVKENFSTCKLYVTPDGKTSGSACKQADGTWKIKTSAQVRETEEFWNNERPSAAAGAAGELGGNKASSLVTKQVEHTQSPSSQTADAKSADEYKKAAEQGDAKAQFNLATSYLRGMGIEKNLERGIQWLHKSADQGLPEAQVLLGYFYIYGVDSIEKDEKEGVTWIRKAAEGGNVKAQSDLGVVYANGFWGVEKNEKEGVRWVRKSAEEGYAKAQELLGSAYLHGIWGIEKDEREAVTWLRKAADQGDAMARLNLGTCYYNGTGVERDYEMAADLFRKSADQGVEQAKHNLRVIYEEQRANNACGRMFDFFSPRSLMNPTKDCEYMDDGTMRVDQSTPEGLLVRSVVPTPDGSPIHVFIYKDNDMDRETVDGQVVKPGYFRYRGILSYESFSGQRSVYSFSRVP